MEKIYQILYFAKRNFWLLMVGGRCLDNVNNHIFLFEIFLSDRVELINCDHLLVWVLLYELNSEMA